MYSKESLQNLLRKERTTFKIEEVANWVGSDATRFEYLISEVAKGNDAQAQRASWCMSHIVEAHPVLLMPHLPQLIERLYDSTTHNGIIRNIMRSLQFVAIPEPLQGRVMNVCFQYIDNPKEKAAIKAFSLTVLYQLSKLYPEVLPEIRQIISHRINNESPAFKARAKIFFKN